MTLKMARNFALLLFCSIMSRQHYSSERLYVGNLPYDVTEREVDDLFYKVSTKYLALALARMHLAGAVQRLSCDVFCDAFTQFGRIRDIEVKRSRKNDTSFAFVVFDDK
mgnify:CR=1 FL=1